MPSVVLSVLGRLSYMVIGDEVTKASSKVGRQCLNRSCTESAVDMTGKESKIKLWMLQQ